MKTLIASFLLFLCGFLSLQAGEKTSDQDAMQGTWLVASLSEKGKAASAEEIALIEIVIDKDTFTTFEKGKVVVKYKFTVDATKSPKQIDFTYLVGDDKDKIELGIYAFDKDQLKICLNEEKKERPTVFTGKDTESYSVIVLKKK